VSRYYCHQCAIKLGYKGCPTTEDVLGSTYQVKKFIKHTVSSPQYNQVSIFDDPSTQAYQDYIVNSFASGCFEIDDRGRGNIILIAGSSAGALYENGAFKAPQDAVKIVLSLDPQRLHAFPIGSTKLSTGVCEGCGKPIITT
jgi:hypothetical protein